MFDEKTKQHLGQYVYLLIDPSTKKPFYVGKGQNDRVFDHVRCALEYEIPNDKYDKIREINSSGNSVGHLIVRHGLTEKEALEIEAALIDTIYFLEPNLGITNIAGGYHSIEKGLMTSDEIVRIYNAEPLHSVGSDCIIININKQYKRGSGEDAIYNATKEIWTIDKKRIPELKYVLSEYKGLIVEVFEVNENDGWYPKRRGYSSKKNAHKDKIGWGFNGKVAPAEIRDLYINKSIAHKKVRGAANAIRYNL